MQAQFWLERWQAGQIGFHEGAPNRFLVQYGSQVLAGKSHVLVPLCGKAVDLIYLHQLGLKVTGVELSAQAAGEFARDNGLTPHIQSHGAVSWHRFEELPRLQIAVTDFFDTHWSDAAGPFDAVYDRAALVALPPPMRVRYARHLTTLCRADARMLLISREHGTDGGPPFSVTDAEIRQLYEPAWALAQLARQDGQDNAGIKSDLVYQALRHP